MTRAANHSSDPQLGNIDQTDWDAKAAELKLKRKKRPPKGENSDVEQDDENEKRMKGEKQGKARAGAGTGSKGDAAQNANHLAESHLATTSANPSTALNIHIGPGIPSELKGAPTTQQLQGRIHSTPPSSSPESKETEKKRRSSHGSRLLVRP
eukprot:g45879.t1